MARYAVAGHKIYIGGPLADKSTPFVAADFTSQTWTQIGEWTSFGDLNDAFAGITSQIINEGRDKHAKGSRNAAATSMVFNLDPLDAGQLACIAADADTSPYAIKIEMNDKPAVGASPKNSQRLFVALVGTQEGGGTANTNRTFTVTLQPVSNFVRVAASAT